MAGELRESMEAVVQALRNDATLQENLASVTYSLEHPTRQLVTAGQRFRINIEPAGFSQLAGRGALNIQYFFWLGLKCKPSALPMQGEEQTSFLIEYLANLIHGKKWGSLWTYLSKAIVNYQSFEMTTNSRNIKMNLAKDEIGAVMIFWQSPKTAAEAAEDEKAEEI